jgi:ribonucleoside-diphosphate reductase alpha subunit
MMSNFEYIHASPTLFNAGIHKGQLSSCFLLGTKDNLVDIMRTISDSAHISKWSGGIGVHVSNIRSAGSYINGTGGKSDGIVPMLRLYNEVARYVNQCFVPETEIITDKGLIQIKNIKVGDKVLTKENEYKQVLDVKVRETVGEQLYATEDKNNIVVSTGEHLFYDYIKKEYIQVKDIKDDTYMGFPLCVSSLLAGYFDRINYHPSSFIVLDEYLLEFEDEIIKKFNPDIFVLDGKRAFIVPDNMNINGILLDYQKASYNIGFHKKYIKEIIDKVKARKVYTYRGKLYDLTVEDNHNYITKIGVVSNSGKRKGAIAIYLEPWCGDINEFLELRLNQGDVNMRTRDLFTAMYINDEFMERVYNDDAWYLMCPAECPKLINAYGDEFKRVYNNYINEGKYIRKVPARTVFNKMLVSQIETGMPYITYKDHVNRKNNQINLGTILSSNLCNEVNLYSDKDQYGVCNIATISLSSIVENGEINYKKLGEIAEHATLSLDRVIDATYYPVPETKKSNIANRPIIVGVQGLYDMFMKLRVPMDSVEAKRINKEVFERIYYHCVKKSVELAKIYGTYETYNGSPFSQGKLQYDLWGLTEENLVLTDQWKELKKEMKKYGIRNSMLTGLPPTVATSKILNNIECFEPITSHIFMRSTMTGINPEVNKYLYNDLKKIGLWNNDMVKKIMNNDGCIEDIAEIPDYIKKLHKNVWEIKQKTLVELSADRGAFIDHSQSLNIYMKTPTINKLQTLHFLTWKLGLKTGLYYLRSKSASTAEKITTKQDVVCTEDVCVSCTG